MTATDDLYRLAQAVGVQTGYWDVFGEHHTAPPETLVAVLQALGLDVSRSDGMDRLRHEVLRATTRLIPDVVITEVGQPMRFALSESALSEFSLPGNGGRVMRVEIVAESGAVSWWDISATDVGANGEVVVSAFVDYGYHRLTVEIGARRDEALLLITPGKVVAPAESERLWGVFAPVYSLWSEDGFGPTTRGLGRLADRAHQLGGAVVGTLPMLATYLREPFDPSPYSPVSRMFWNELFVDLEAITGTQIVLGSLDRHGVDRPDGLGDFDYAEREAIVDAAIREAADVFFDSGARGNDASCGPYTRGDFDAFLARRSEVVDYARFRATVDRSGTGWHAWPTRQRSGRLQAGDYDPPRVRHHLFAQWLMDRQMRQLGDKMSERGQHLYLDLPVGSHGDGYDTWRFSGSFVSGVAAGAPPDELFSGGQNWGFPPVSPWAGRDDGYGYLRACLGHQMEVAGVLRLDHVMQLERLWWVPDGAAAPDGVYVNYPLDELFAVVAIESHRHNCMVVGENLGTVSDDVTEAMGRYGMAGMYVAQFEMPSWAGAELAEPPDGCVAAFDTHDTPTFAGFLSGDGDPDRHQQVENMRGFLAAREYMQPEGDDHDLLLALLGFMGDSDAWMVLVTLEDLWGGVNPQNIPGTTFDRPNWVQRLVLSLDDLEGDVAGSSVADDLAVLDATRWRSHQRATEVTP